MGIEGNPLALSRATAEPVLFRAGQGKPEGPREWTPLPFSYPSLGLSPPGGERGNSAQSKGRRQRYPGFLHSGRPRLSSVTALGAFTFPVSQ